VRAGFASGPSVEDGANAELATRLCRVAQRGVMRRREEERDARLSEDRRLMFRRDVDRDAERLDDIGAAAATRDGAIAVLGDRDARPGDDDRGGRREVQGTRAVAAGSARVEHGGQAMLHRLHRLAERLRPGGDGIGVLSSGAQGDRETRDLHRGPRPVEDRRERLPDDRARRGASIERVDHLSERGGAHEAFFRVRRRSTQFPSSALPEVVRMLSG